MRIRSRYFLSLTTVLLTACQLSSQSLEGVRPKGIPPDRDLVAFSNRAEGGILASLVDTSPVIEGYFQKFIPSQKIGYSLDSDRYVLGRFRWSDGPAIDDLLNYQSTPGSSGGSGSAGDQPLLDGLLQLMVPDWSELRPERYEYKYVRRELLGAVRCVVYDVTPLKPESGFIGRLYIEDKYWNIVRFTGMSPNVDRLFSTLRAKNTKFRIDNWRTNVVANRWVPAYTYVEEVPPLGASEAPLVKGQVRFWGYDRTDNQLQQQFTDVVVSASPATIGGRKRQPPSPQESERLFEGQAENNVLSRLHQARFLGSSGELEKMLDQVVTNLVITNKVVLGNPVHCRVLLTTPLEAFTVGNTVVVSRGLIDVLPTESAIALVLAHQLAHYILGHRNVDTKLAFFDVLRITDSELLAKLHFRHSPNEEAEADKKALELLEQSPYKDKASEGGLFIQALQAHASQLKNLIQPTFGEHVADIKEIVRDNDLLRTTPVLDEELPGQVAALPLGAKLLMNPWNGQIQLLRSEPLSAPTLRERAELSVTPFMPFLDYVTERSNVTTAPTMKTQRQARPAGAAVRAVAPGKKGTS